MRKLIYILFLLPFLGLAQELKVNEIKYQPIAQPSNPEEGDTYYDNTAQTLYFWNGVTWINTGAAGGGGGGDIGGSIDDNQIAVGSATANQIEGSGGLTYNGTTLSVSGKISVSDPGNSVFVGDLAGANDDATDNRNVGIGSGALGNITGGFYNTAIGYNAGGTLSDGITGVSSVNTGTYIGMETSPSATLGVANETVLGYNATGNGSNTVTIGNTSVTANYFSGDINLTGNVNGVDIAGVFREGTNPVNAVTWIGADAARASLYIDPSINRIELFQNVGNSLRMTPNGMTLQYYGGSGNQMLYVNNNGEVLTQAIPGGGGYVPAANVSLNGSADFTVTDANRTAAGQIINVLSAFENIQIELVDVNAAEIDKYQFNVDDASGGLAFTSPGGFVVDGITAGQAVRLGGIGAVDFEETSPNSGAFRVYAGTNVSFINIPTVTSATIENADPDALVVVFSEPVNSLTSTGLSLDGDLSDATISPTSGSGTNTVTYTMSRPAVGGETGNFVYGATNEITDVNGYISLAPGSTSVTNNVTSAYSPNNLYTEASAVNADNQSLTLGNWSINYSQTLTPVVDAGGSAGGGANAFRIQGTGPTGNNYFQIQLDLAALGLDGDGPINSGEDYDVKFDMKVVSMPATENDISLEITGAGSNGFHVIPYGSDGQSTYTNYSRTFTADGAQSFIRLYLGTPNTDATGTYDVYLKNLEIVPTGQ